MKKYLFIITTTTITTTAAILLVDYLYRNYKEQKILDDWFKNDFNN